MYSPFYDRKGNPIAIGKVRFIHLSQLKECEEGHHIEYKLKLEDGGKNQLAKEITSFANCEGGWLIVGIEDKTRELYPIEKKDYSQKIGKIALRISPLPIFETQFIEDPNDKTKGILLIYVFEGRQAPYVCDGTIFVRCGSNKEPIKAAERGNVEYLIRRTEQYQKELDDFFKRDYYFEHDNIIFQKTTYPIVTVYLKNISPSKNKWFNSFENRNKTIEFIKKKHPEFKYSQFTMNSIVFMSQYYYPKKVGSIIFELFYDFSFKLYLPLASWKDDFPQELKYFYYEMGVPFEKIKDFYLIDAGISCNSLMAGLICFKDIATKFKLKEDDFVFCFEVENAGNCILFFSGDKYKEYVKSNGGIPYAVKSKNKSKYVFLRDHKEVKFKDIVGAVINDFFGPAFGFESDVIWELLKEDNLRYLK